MEDAEHRSIANRDEPLPMLRVNEAETPTLSDTGESKSTKDKRGASPWRLQEKLKDVGSSYAPSIGIQDRIFASIFQQIIPTQGMPDDGAKPDRRSSKYVERPHFSLNVMSSNFRRFNARIGVIFVFENRLIRLFSWTAPTQTLSFLAVYTFCCLDPSLLAALPLGLCLFFIMVPAFTVRHPPPPNSLVTEMHNLHGPASAPPPSIKPAPEMSKDFFRNMRDLQNSMEDFSQLHDRVLKIVAPLTNFADERLSSTVFLGLCVTVCALFIASSLLPWRLVFLAVGWIVVGSVHPSVVKLIEQMDKAPIKKQVKRGHNALLKWMNEDIVLDEAPEVREVEVFELQRRDGDDWEGWLFSTTPYTPTSPLRVSGDRPRGTRFFEDVQPPKGWEWSGKKWTLDLSSRDWVEERMVSSVEIETEGERWVYDIATNEYGEEIGRTITSGREPQATKDWEESSAIGPKGEWRRRRWVRLVKRKVVRKSTPAARAK